MSSNVMRQIEERHVPTCVEIMVWCDCIDLLALSNTKGEVQLHRLNWHRVWNLPPPQENSRVSGLAWRPDGKVLAVGYDCGRISLVDVEDKEVLFSSRPSRESNLGGVTCLSWKQKCTTKLTRTYGNDDDSSIYLPAPPALTSNYKSSDKSSNPHSNHSSGISYKRFDDEMKDLNILLVGYENGEIHLSVFGQFFCGIVDVREYMQCENIGIVNIELSSDFKTLQTFVKNMKDDGLSLVLINTEVLAAYSDELHALAARYDNITNIMGYIDQTMGSIVEAWEQILLEMDSKLEKYASNVSEGGVAADFLELLILGVPSAELELFLLQDLTAKGLKKFGTSIELCYSTIQKLVVKQLNTIGHNLTFHLAELRGMARIPHRYKFLGLEEECVNHAIVSSSAYINKCLELQQVIEHSMKNYKAFFRWLFVVIMRLMDEHVPSDINKINQQDLTYIAEFLQNFDKVGNLNKGEQSAERKGGKFTLERLGQYLVNKELTITPDDEENLWIKFLKENPCFANSPCIIPQGFKKFSLVQQQIHLKSVIQNLFDHSKRSLTTQFKLFDIVNCLPSSFTDEKHADSLRLTQINDINDNALLVAFTDPLSADRGFHFLEVFYRNESVSVRTGYFYFLPLSNMNDSKLDSLLGNNMNVIDVQFYSKEILSVLLEKPNDSEISAFVQFPVELCVKHLKDVNMTQRKQSFDILRNTSRINALSILEKGAVNVLDKMSAKQLAVSGSRKVAVVLSKTCRKVRLFEMEADGEDDEDETLDTTQQSHSSAQQSDQSQYISLNETGLQFHQTNEENNSDIIDLDNPSVA